MTSQVAWTSLVFYLCGLFLDASCAGDMRHAAVAPIVYLPEPAITAANLALVVNERDPISRAIAAILPAGTQDSLSNIVSVSFRPAFQ